MRISLASLTVVALLPFGLACSDPVQKLKDNNGTTSNNGTVAGTNNGTSAPNNGTVAPNNGTVVLNNGLPDTDQVDILMVVDNSGSMCQEQAQLRDGARAMFARLVDDGIDFQVGITTTDTNPDYPLEPVARPGALQSTPQPLPGFDRSCHGSGSFAPLRAMLENAVGCMTNPDESYLSISDADIECALYNSPQGCSIASAGCSGDCTAEDIFPDPSEYRALPLVLRSADYGGDIDRLVDDFACASMVGTRGYGIERGLEAAVLAVSPNLTNGTNAGFLRETSKFAVVFVTDENDCSHDGSLDETTPCGGDVCEFQNRVSATDSALREPSDLAAELIANLSSSKGVDVSGSDVMVASLAGRPARYDGPQITAEQCSSADYEGISPSCETALGSAYSSDRYARFMAPFPEQNQLTDPDTGWLCTGSISEPLVAIADGIVAYVR